jgi:hypothetical protein
MSNMNVDEVVNYLPNASRNLPTNDEKFLFFFDPQLMDEKKFLFGFSLKTGVQVFAVVSLIQAISTFFDIFSPDSFIMFFANIVIFLIYLVIGAYALLSTIKNDYCFAKVSYLIAAALFLLNALKYVCKSVIKVIEFITPWDGDFLRLDFLVYIFGYGIFLLIILYLIYVLYHYMLELKQSNAVINKGDEEIPLYEPKSE